MPIPAASAAPVLDDLKTRANITSSTHDVELQDMLDAAVGAVEGLIGPIDSVTVTETHYDVSRGLPLLLKRRPVLSVTSIADSYSNAYAADDYDLQADAGIVRLLATTGTYAYWSGDVTVTYTAGRESLDPEIREAILLTAVDLWTTQRGNAPSALPVSEETGLPVNPNSLPVIPPRALSYLREHLRGL